MATQVKFDRLHTLAEALLSTADQNTIYFTTDTHKVVMKGDVYGANYTLPAATSSVLGGVKLGSDTMQTVDASTPTSVADRTYPVQFNSTEQMAINVPWEDSLPVWENEPNADEIWYTSSDGNTVDPYTTSALPRIDTNTYSDGKGVIKCASDITSIGDAAFFDCSSLTSVMIPDQVETIRMGAFWGCTSLISVTILNSVRTIGDQAFSGCASLTSVTIPNSVESIGTSAFLGCTSLTSVTIPNSVRTIGPGAFGGCTSLISVTIGNSVTSIEQSAFDGCSSLISINISNSVASIGNRVFADCSSLTSIEIPNSVTSIGNYAFRSCTSLISITYTGTSSQWNNIIKGTDWHDGVPATVVHCSDGDVNL